MTDRNKIISTIKGQLETDAFLGGQWLPNPPATPVDWEPPEAAAPQSQQQPMTDSTEPEERDSTIATKAQKLKTFYENLTFCDKCKLHSQRTNLVPGEGNPNARIFFVGEAPGQKEDEQGRPFVGRAGTLLGKIINAMGLKREDVYIGNILKCRPPNNRDPLPDEIAACIDYLYEQLEIVDPEIIVALGSHAAHTLLDCNTPIGQLRGRVHNYVPHPMAKPIKLVATYHPAYLLRSYSTENRQKVWNDMQLVLKEAGLPIPRKGT